MQGLGMTLSSRLHMTSVQQCSTEHQIPHLPSPSQTTKLCACLYINYCRESFVTGAPVVFFNARSHLLTCCLNIWSFWNSFPHWWQRSWERKWSYHTKPIPFMCTLQMQTLISVYDSCAGEAHYHENETLGSRQQGLKVQIWFLWFRRAV